MTDESKLKALWDFMQKNAKGFEGPKTPCPDCASVAVPGAKGGSTLKHEGTCPLYGGLEKVCDGDRKFFESHPSTDEYYRPISRAEIIDFEYMLGSRVPEGVYRVRVKQIAPGIRTRQPIGIDGRKKYGLAADRD